MKKCFIKGFSIFVSAFLLAALAIPVSATKDVTVTASINGLNPDLVISNKISSNGESNRADVEGYLIKSGLVTFTFSERMDISTLIPENITITPAKNTSSGQVTFIAQGTLNADGTLPYKPYAVTDTTYSIAIGDMLEGKLRHDIVFTSRVKTAAGEEMTPYETGFTTGRIAKMPVKPNKIIKNVAYGKTAMREDGTERNKMTSYAPSYNKTAGIATGSNQYTRIDLGNYYDVADVMVVSFWGAFSWATDRTMEIRYSCDPKATGAEATLWGEVAKGQYYKNSSGDVELSDGGRGGTRWLHPQKSVRARYIFIKADGDAGEQICNVEVLAYVDADFDALKATKDGQEVTEFVGDGTYVVSSKVSEYFAGAADSYMIVAGYDANGVVTTINCAPVSKTTDNVLSLETTFGANTVSMKACLLKSFSQPQMLTDALTLPAAQ